MKISFDQLLCICHNRRIQSGKSVLSLPKGNIHRLPSFCNIHVKGIILMETKSANEEVRAMPENHVMVIVSRFKRKDSTSPSEKNEASADEYSEIVNNTLILLDEDDSNYYGVFLCPGVSKDRIEVKIADGRLFITAGPVKLNDSEKGARPYLWESVGRMSYAGDCELSEDVYAEDATAELKDGVLYLLIPKAEGARPVTVQVE